MSVVTPADFRFDMLMFIKFLIEVASLAAWLFRMLTMPYLLGVRLRCYWQPHARSEHAVAITLPNVLAFMAVLQLFRTHYNDGTLYACVMVCMTFVGGWFDEGQKRNYDVQFANWVCESRILS